MDYTMTKQQVKAQIEAKLSHFMGVSPQDASDEHYYRALALILKEKMNAGRKEFVKDCDSAGKKKIVYLCMEFLMGRSLKNTLYSLNLTDVFREALQNYGVKLDGLATQGYHATGYSILYEYGIFKQKLVDGWQTELPDFWLPGGEVWLEKRDDSVFPVLFEGHIEESWDNQYHHIDMVDAKQVYAVPYDLYVAGKDGRGISVLRLWRAQSPGIDMEKFNQGDYMRAMEQNAMAEVISKILYPSDNHPEGKSLRLRQQYFLVSASIQDVVGRHLRRFGTIDNFAEEVAIHINDTHPTMAIPEMMRILLDECGYGWDEAWNIVTKTFAYTNHTVMKEALECWSEELVSRLLPRIYQIIKEIDNRYRGFVWSVTGDADKVERMAVISGGAVRMANLCVAACHSVNGVSALHSEILKETVFRDFYSVTPDKFTNVTNGIAYRRWLCQANPELTELIADLIGEKFILDGDELQRLREFREDKGVLQMMQKIKRDNKSAFADYIRKTTGVTLDPDSVFDVQVKRLHEYKRQHLNAFQILSQYLAIKENPNGDFTPHTYIFAAKAAPGYFMAKKIICFICAMADMINNDPDVKGRLKVIFVEDYNVSVAERLMPAAEISEQISLAGTEASGTGNMKLMINGAVTLGTMDGANVEIFEAVGKDNILIFGMNADEVRALQKAGYYPGAYYQNNADIRRVIDRINAGIGGKMFPEIGQSITNHDPYMVLADFADYRAAQQRAVELYKDKTLWTQMSLMNIAGAGRFAADRAVNEYARNIWHA